MIKAKPTTKARKPRKAAKKARSGPPLEQIARELGVSISTIWRWENDGVPGKGLLKNMREAHLKAAREKLAEQGAA